MPILLPARLGAQCVQFNETIGQRDHSVRNRHNNLTRYECLFFQRLSLPSRSNIS
jgi:hypothetical protein